MDETYDVVVVGGGAAGLSGALALGRARRSVLVVDEGEPRNAPAGQVHNYLGREGTPPARLLAIGRREVERYGVRIRQDRARTARREPDGGFVVGLGDGQVRARRLLVTTGLVDELPEVPGVAAEWGRSVVHCPYCHGWEVRDQPIGVLGTSGLSVRQALMWRQWSDDIVLLRHTAPAWDADDDARLAARGIRVVDGHVTGWEAGGARLAGGDLVARRVLVVAAPVRARAGILLELGAETAQWTVDGECAGTYVAADASGLTTVPGVWVAGNVADPRAQVIAAAAAGLAAGAAVNADLIAEDTRVALRSAACTPR